MKTYTPFEFNAIEIITHHHNISIRETEQKKVSQQKLKEEMEQFYIARAMWKAKERLLIQQEDEKIKHINNEKKRQREVAGAQELAKKSASEEISNKLLKEFLLKQVSVCHLHFHIVDLCHFSFLVGSASTSWCKCCSLK